jgi:nucleotide-binding universal stress UspA family protein
VYRHLVVGTDGSDTAGRAVAHAAQLASACKASLTIVSVYDHHVDDAARLPTDAPEEVHWALTDAAAADDKVAQAKAAARAGGVADVHSRVEPGDPASVLLDVAAEVGADAIVVGSRGMASLSGLVLGSVPNRVSHHAQCDVLIVRTTD